MASIEDLLLMKAVEDAAAIPTNQEAAAVGALAGAGAGVLMGHESIKQQNFVNNIKDAIASKVMPGFTPVKAPVLKPGKRMAGGLVGAVLGGGLGMGVRQMMIQDSPAAELLAKAQVQGELSPADKRELQGMLEEIYSEMGLR